jgi:predicted MFS family arabinose efflux permease
MTTVSDAGVGVWADRNFRRLWGGSAASRLGGEVAEIALPLFALLTLSAGPGALSGLRVAQFLPFLLATLPLGLLVDRQHRHRLRLMLGADLGRFVLVGLIPLAAWLGFATLGLLYGAVFAVGVLTVLYQVADFAFLPSIVRPDQLVDANGKLAATESAAEIGGRGVGGVLVQAVSAPVALLANALGFAVSALCLSRIRTTAPQQEPEREQRGMAAGLRVVVRDRYVRALLGEATTFNLCNEVFLLGLLVWAVRDVGLGPATIGLVFTAGGVGSFAGAWFGARLTGRFGYGRVLLITMVLGNGAPLALFAAGRGTAPALLIAVFVLMGVGIGIADVHAVSLRQTALPEHLRGRANAAYRLISWGAIPLGAAVGGVLASATDARTAMLAGAVGVATATLWVAFSAVPRLRSLQDAAATMAR